MIPKENPYGDILEGLACCEVCLKRSLARLKTMVAWSIIVLEGNISEDGNVLHAAVARKLGNVPEEERPQLAGTFRSVLGKLEVILP
jgi:hypothetical protein